MTQSVANDAARPCRMCGALFDSRDPRVPGGKRYCSRRCRLAAANQRRRAAGQLLRALRQGAPLESIELALAALGVNAIGEKGE